MKTIKTIGYTTVIFIASLIFISCVNDGFLERDRTIPHTGEVGEVIVVLEKEHWESQLANSIREALEVINYSLPQPEPFLHVKFVSSNHYSNLSKTHHSIFMVKLKSNDTNLTPSIEGPTIDTYAKGQILYTLYARNLNEATAVVKANAQFLFDVYNTQTRNIALKNIKKATNPDIKEELELTLKLSTYIPSGFSVSGNFNNAVWLSQLRSRYADGNDHEIQIGLLYYTYPYLDSATFSLDWQLNKRDSITKKIIKGSLPNSYMTTQRLEGVHSKELMYNDTYLFEIRGLWRMENAIMGGPFMSISFFDQPNKRIVTLDGFVYAPYFRKMDYMREIEAILYSYNLVE